MKRLIYLAAVVAAYVFASCTKAETEPVVDSVIESAKVLPSIEILVNALDGTVDDGVTTRAVKTSWVAGDKINIWFDLGPFKYGTSLPSKDEHLYPEVVMTYNGSYWDYEYSSFFDPTKLTEGSGKALRAVYESSNDFNKTFYQPYQKPSSNELFHYYTTSAYKTNYYKTPMIVHATSTYTYDSEKNKITAMISNWTFMTKVQVYITGLTQDPSYYTLCFQDDSEHPGTTGRFFRTHGFNLSTDGLIYPVDALDPNFGVMGCTRDENGVYFYYYDAVSPGVAMDYKVQLGYVAGKTPYYGNAEFSNKVINTSPNSLTCIKMSKSLFSNNFAIK